MFTWLLFVIMVSCLLAVSFYVFVYEPLKAYKLPPLQPTEEDVLWEQIRKNNSFMTFAEAEKVFNAEKKHGYKESRFRTDDYWNE